MKNIGIVSDLHLEGSKMNELENPGWDYLIVAGDLSANYEGIDYFFAHKAPKDIPILYVLGNHEYEGKRVNEVVDKIRDILKPYDNVILLNNESIILDGIKFIGSTLWSNFELDGVEKVKENMQWANNNISDFSYMLIKPKNEEKYRLLKPEDMREESKKAIEYLRCELIENKYEGETVVITHFAPHPNSVNPDYAKEKNSYWVNNLEDLMGYSKYWFHGHTHSNYNYNVNGTEVICNPRGYSKLYDIAANFDFNRTISFPIQEKLKNKHKLA